MGDWLCLRGAGPPDVRAGIDRADLGGQSSVGLPASVPLVYVFGFSEISAFTWKTTGRERNHQLLRLDKTFHSRSLGASARDEGRATRGAGPGTRRGGWLCEMKCKICGMLLSPL